MNIGTGGRSYLYSKNRARAALGTAQAGVLSIGTGSGDFAGSGFAQRASALFDGDYNAVTNYIDNTANTDAGNAAAGYVSLGRTYVEHAGAANDPGAVAATAVGNAAAGGVTVMYADRDGAFIGE